MRVDSIVIVVGDRSISVPLNLTNGQTFKVKMATDDGLIEMIAQPRMAEKKKVMALGKAQAEMAKKNAERGREVRQANVEAQDVYVERLLSHIAEAQRLWLDMLFKRLRFVSNSRECGYSTATGKWVKSVMDVCPEPWRLDFGFLQKWLSSPHTAANASDKELKAGRKVSAMMIRRAVARKQFIAAWEEQIGPVTVAPKIPTLSRTRGVVSQASSHPFSVILHWWQEGRVQTREDIEGALADYADSGSLTEIELIEARRMLSSGTWMGEEL